MDEEEIHRAGGRHPLHHPPTRKRDIYRDFSETIQDILADAIRTRDLRVNEIQMRAKTVDSFGKKAMTPKKENSDEPKYKDPLAEITDLAGVRVITFFPRTVDEVGRCIHREFEVVEPVDHTATAQQEERLGYQSVHYLVRLADNRRRLPEYPRFDGLVAEVQVRTVMQHDGPRLSMTSDTSQSPRFLLR
jgi:ppGpp synthetase/RelA/SpoT-type nucleotidyltranferase